MKLQDRYIIGIDLGHGETSVAKTNLRVLDSPEIVEINNHRSQITAISYHPNAGVLIGNEALGTPMVSELDICFKKKPCDDDKYKQLIQDYLETLYNKMISEGSVNKHSQNHFFIGCPSGWSETERERYEQVLSSSGINNLKVARESRAAFLHAKESGKIDIAHLKSAILVIDIGSSTTDFTLVTERFDKPLDDFGVDLGASLIDKSILEYSLTKSEDKEELEEILSNENIHRIKCEIACRKAKEAYFSNPELYQHPETSCGVLHKIKKGLAFEPIVNRISMEEILVRPIAILGNKSWPQTFRDELIKAKNRLEQEKVLLKVLLVTGGASRMGFIKQICKEIFPEAEYVRDSEPECAIAKGLARWGRFYLQSTAFEEEMNLFLKEELPAIINKYMASLVESLVEPLTNGLLENMMKPSLRKWRARQIETLNQLEPYMSRLAGEWLKSEPAKQVLSVPTNEWVKKIQEEIDQKTKGICQKHLVPPESMKVGVKYGYEKTSNLVTQFTSDPTILSSLGDLVSVIVAVVIAALSGGGGIALIVHGPIGIIIGIILGIIIAAVGRGKAEEWIKNWDMPEFMRKMVLWESWIENPSESQVQEIEKGVRVMFDKKVDNKSLTVKEEICTTICQSLKESIQQKADVARLLIG